MLRPEVLNLKSFTIWSADCTIIDRYVDDIFCDTPTISVYDKLRIEFIIQKSKIIF